MASFSEKIRLIFDVDANPAKAGFGNFAKSIREAEGATGKFKAALSGINQAGTAFALAGGAGLITVAMRGAEQFTALAKSSIDLGKSVGVTTEEASRWIAVGDDAGVTAQDLQSGMGKIAKSLDSGKWEQYGIATRDAAGNARSANDVMLDALDVLSRTTNETERARIGNELFGKGYASLAPLVGKTRGEYEAMLGAVSDGQVITDQEAAKAEKLRLAQDNLGDALRDVTIALGGVVAAAAPLLDLTAKLLGPVEKLTATLTGSDAKSLDGALKKFDKAAKESGGNLGDLGGAFDDLAVSAWNARSTMDKARGIGDPGAAFRSFRDTFAELAQRSPEYAAQVYDSLVLTVQGAERGRTGLADYANEWGLTQATLQELLPYLSQGAQDLASTGGNAAEAASSVQNLADEYAGLLDLLDDQDSYDNVQTSFEDVQKAADDAFIAATTGADNADVKTREYNRKLRQLERDVIKYSTAVEGIPKNAVSEILVAIDSGSLTEAQTKFDALKKPETKVFVIETSPHTDRPSPLPNPNYRSSKDVTWHAPMAPGVSLPYDGHATTTTAPGGPSRASHDGVVIQNAYFNTTAKLTPEEVARLMAEWERRTGLRGGSAPKNAR